MNHNEHTVTPKQAAKIIGCSPQHVRTMIRAGNLTATKRATDANQHGYEWVITRLEAERARDYGGGRGRPRGPLTKEKAHA